MSRLNQVEIWFGILTRSALRHCSFADVRELAAAIYNSGSTGTMSSAAELELELRAAHGSVPLPHTDTGGAVQRVGRPRRHCC
jgi:hypothetical protein